MNGSESGQSNRVTIEAALGSDSTRPPVLLVDNHSSNLDAIEEVLSGLDLRPIRAASGEEAAGFLLRQSFAAVLLDVRMSGMDGFETAELIRTRKDLKDLPILFITAHEFPPEEIARGYSLGAVDFISKPIVPEMLRAKVALFLELFRKNMRLQSREALLLDAERLAHLGSWEWDPASDRVTWSDELYRIFGVLPQTFHPKLEEILARIHPDDRERFRHRLEKALQDGNPFDHEERILRPDGTVRTLHSRGRVILDPSRRPLRIICSCLDITERKALEGQEARAHLAAVVDSSDDAIITKSLEGFVKTWNLGAERIFGYTPAEAIGQHISFLFPPSHIDEDSKILGKIHRGQRVEHYETVRRRKDGTLIDVSLTVSPLRDATDSIIGFSKIARDITARKQADAETRDLNSSLEQRVRERTQALNQAIAEMESFMYTMAHDLRAPLRAIAGYSTLLLSPTSGLSDPSERELFLRRIEGGAQTMDKLIQDLLAYGHLAHSHFRSESTDLESVVKDVLIRFETQILDQGASIRIESPLGRVQSDPDKLKRVLENLLSNSLKFMPPGRKPEVRVRTELRDGWVRLWLEDNGIGIEEQFHARIWRVFERLNRVEDYPGTGMGLAIVKRAVERMGGRSGVTSEPSKGSRFWIELPPGEDSPAAEPPSNPG
jgi:PAS domain S-box-containing protein